MRALFWVALSVCVIVSAPTMLVLLIAFACYGVLLYQLGFFDTLIEHRKALAFEAKLLEIGQEDEWEHRMTRIRQRLPSVHRQPSLQFRPRSRSCRSCR